MNKEAMKLAWEAEEKANPQTRYNSWCRGYEAALREALAKPDFWEGYVPEPVKPAQQKPLTKEDIFAIGGVVAHDNVFFINLDQLNALVGIKENT